MKSLIIWKKRPKNGNKLHKSHSYWSTEWHVNNLLNDFSKKKKSKSPVRQFVDLNLHPNCDCEKQNLPLTCRANLAFNISINSTFTLLKKINKAKEYICKKYPNFVALFEKKV